MNAKKLNMLKLANAIFYKCPECRRKYVAYANEVGEVRYCKSCDSSMVVPDESTYSPPLRERSPKVESTTTESGLTDASLTIPGMDAKIQTKVTQKTADSAFMAFVGGALVVVGIIASIIFGVRMPTNRA